MTQYALSVLAQKPYVLTPITQRSHITWHDVVVVIASSLDEAIGKGYGYLEEERPNRDSWAHHVRAIEIERLENDGND